MDGDEKNLLKAILEGKTGKNLRISWIMALSDNDTVPWCV